MAATVILALVLWIFGRNFIDATMVAVALVCVMVIFGIIQWDDLLGNKSAWNHRGAIPIHLQFLKRMSMPKKTK